MFNSDIIGLNAIATTRRSRISRCYEQATMTGIVLLKNPELTPLIRSHIVRIDSLIDDGASRSWRTSSCRVGSLFITRMRIIDAQRGDDAESVGKTDSIADTYDP